jgi:hypothetical protein
MNEPISDEEMLDVGAVMIACHFHDTYERLAPKFGYDTRAASRRPWCSVPEANRSLMVATVRVVLSEQIALLDAAIERAEKAEAERDRFRAVVESAQAVGDSNFRKLEEALRKGSWGGAADRVQEFRKILAALTEPKCDCGNPNMTTPEGQHHIFCATRAVLTEPEDAQ